MIAIAVTNYQVYTQTAGTAPNTFPIVNYLYPESYNAHLSSLNYTLQVMNFFEQTFGTYPFADEKYGHAQFGWGGGMEHTTVSFMGSFGTGLIAHELAHHWFGNKITCGTWKDIWLNEGFAEYATGMAVEHFNGANAFRNWKGNKVMHITLQSGGNLYLTDEQALNSSRIFSSRITYSKGSMVVHMLRKQLGDAVFLQAIQNYLNDSELAYGFAVTEQLKNHLENASGQDLTEFFNDWVFGQGFPIYEAQAHVNSGVFHLTLNQTTSHASVPFFEMPVRVRATDVNNNVEDFVVNHQFSGQTFALNTQLGALASVEIDPDFDIIRQVGNVSLGVNEMSYEDQIKIVPNPTHNTFEFVLPAQDVLKEWQVFDMNGNKITQGFQKQVDASSWASGMYICEIYTQEGTFRKKIVKE